MFINGSNEASVTDNNNQSTAVTANATLDGGSNQTIDITNSLTTNVGANQSVDVGGNQNWLRFGPVQIQPSEFAKLALIVWCGTVFHLKRGRLHEPLQLALPLLPFGGLIVALVLAGKDLGTGLILGLILVLVMWFVGFPLRVLAPLGAGALSLIHISEPTRPY